MLPMSKFIKPPSADYDDDVLYGSRREATRIQNLIKVKSNSECIMFSVGTFVNKLAWSITNIIGSDKRLKSMFEGTQITHPYPIQRYCWPQMEHSEFPVIFISPESSGKTTSHLLFIVARSISAVPISETNRLLVSSYSKDKYSVINVAEDLRKANQDPTSGDEFKNIDHSDFDFDSFGREPQDTTSGDNHLNNGSGVKSEDHFEVNPDEFIIHPQYILICSSHQQVERLDQEIERMKLAAYEIRNEHSKLKDLPPKVRIIHVHQADDKLAIKCSEAQILIATPGALIKCIKLEFIRFDMCQKVIFDDLDLTLQLHNSSVREIIKYYLVQTQCELKEVANEQQDGSNAQIYLFSRKWTELVRQFLSTVFPQRVIVFGSISEASLYANLRYDVEVLKDVDSKLKKLTSLIKVFYTSCAADCKMAVLFATCLEAKQTSLVLESLGYQVTYLPSENSVTTFKSLNVARSHSSIAKPVYLLSDATLEFIVNHMIDITHLIHFSLPTDMLLFDQRFRLLFKHINDSRKNIYSSVFLRPQSDGRRAKELYDIVTRSPNTLNSTKLTLRDYVGTHSKTICWRWAATGLCRLEKLSKDDRLGSYCMDRHSVKSERHEVKKWPTGGQLRVTVTHILSPNEFYFWFEGHRDIKSTEKRWNNLPSTGKDFMQHIQIKLNLFKDTPPCSVPLHQIKKASVYGIYLPEESRVDRILLLNVPDLSNYDLSRAKKDGIMSSLYRTSLLEYSKQVEVIKIDYGIRVSVYLRNIFFISEELTAIEPQAHRGFLIGVKPTDNEPNWLHKAKRFFYEQVCVNNLYDVTVWLRLNSNNCFWFESMIVTRKLSNLDTVRLYKSEPHVELCKAGLAEKVNSSPYFLPLPERMQTLSKWNATESEKYATYSFLRNDKSHLDIFILQVLSNLHLNVRQIEFNRQLIDLERDITSDFESGKLQPLTYLEEGVYGIARIIQSIDPKSQERKYTFNRCRIKTIIRSASDQDKIEDCDTLHVTCLDHGDLFEVRREDLFQALPEHIKKLPFQAITCKIAHLNEKVLEDSSMRLKLINQIYDCSRDSNEQYISLKCIPESKTDLNIYIPLESGLHEPLIGHLEKKNNITISENDDPELRKEQRFEDTVISNPIHEALLKTIIGEILLDIIEQARLKENSD